MPRHEKYIATQEFNKLTSESFVATLKQAKVVNKDDITYFVKKKHFNEKQININKKVTLNKTGNLEIKKLDNLLEKVKLISTGELTKNLINKYSVLNSG